MLLKSKQEDVLIKINEVDELINPFKEEIMGEIQAGQNEQPPESFKKSALVFPSGEKLPQCWVDSDYKAKWI